MTTHRFNLTTRIVLRDQEYKFLPDESFPGAVFVNDTGARAIIYKIQNLATKSIHALKIFRPQFQHSYTRANFDYMQQHLARIPAFNWIADRFIINHADDGPLLRAKANEYLENAIVMPWLDYDSITDIRFLLRAGHLELTHDDANKIAKSFVHSMQALEQAGFAHGDIASSNILIDTNNHTVHIIDIEDMYHDALSKPTAMSTGVGGSQGYRFSNSFSSWDHMADRFASAIVIAELLTLADADIHAHVISEHKETTFTQMEIDLRHQENAVALTSVLEAKLSSGIPLAGALFSRAMNATSLSRVPTLAEWYTIFPSTIIPYVRPATSKTPTLMVFLLDLSRSMWLHEVPTKDGPKSRIKLATEVIGEVITQLLSRCRVGRYQFSDRYHIAIIGYHTKTANLLFSDRLLAGGGDQETENFMRYGIAPISMWANLQENVDNLGTEFTRGIGEKISLGPQNTEGETHTTQALEYVHTLLEKVIGNYQDCHPPYIMHITDGAANDVGEPEKDRARLQAFNKVTNLATDYGKVLVSTVYIGQSVLAASDTGEVPDNFAATWKGITDSTPLRGQRANWGEMLRNFSSRMPDPYTEQMHKSGYDALEYNTYLFFPGNNPEMLSLAINNAASTGK